MEEPTPLLVIKIWVWMQICGLRTKRVHMKIICHLRVIKMFKSSLKPLVVPLRFRMGSERVLKCNLTLVKVKMTPVVNAQLRVTSYDPVILLHYLN